MSNPLVGQTNGTLTATTASGDATVAVGGAVTVKGWHTANVAWSLGDQPDDLHAHLYGPIAVDTAAIGATLALAQTPATGLNHVGVGTIFHEGQGTGTGLGGGFSFYLAPPGASGSSANVFDSTQQIQLGINQFGQASLAVGAAAIGSAYTFQCGADARIGGNLYVSTLSDLAGAVVVGLFNPGTGPMWAWGSNPGSNFTYGVNASVGTNLAGTDVSMLVGLPTGNNVNGGSIRFKVSAQPLGSGSTGNSPIEAMTIKSATAANANAFVGVNNTAPANELDVLGTACASFFAGKNARPLCVQDISMSAAGTGTLTLSATQVQNGSIRFTGVLTGNRNVQVPRIAGAQARIFNGTTGAGFFLTFGSSAGNIVWCPRGQWVDVYCDGTNWIAEHWGQECQITYNNISTVLTSGSTTNTQLDTIPILGPYKAVRVLEIGILSTTTLVGGTSTFKLGTASAGVTLINAGTIGAAGTVAGFATADLGTDFASANNWRARYTANLAIWLQQAQTVANCTAGVIAVEIKLRLEGGG